MAPPTPNFDKVLIHFPRHEDRTKYNVGFFESYLWADVASDLTPEPESNIIQRRWRTPDRLHKYTIEMTERDGKTERIPCRLFVRVQSGS